MPDAALTDLKTNALTIATKPILDALVSLQANPTTFNLAAQGVALQGALVGAAPALETLGIKDVAALLHDKITAALAAVEASPATAPSPAPSPAAA
jgi:hypothetical protein